MMSLPVQRSGHRLGLVDLLEQRSAEVVDVRAGVHAQTHRLTISDRRTGERMLIAVTADREESVPAVEQEGRLLVELRRGDFGPSAQVAPRHLGVAEHDGRPVLLLSPAEVPPAGPGAAPSRADIGGLSDWLFSLWRYTGAGAAPAEIGADAYDVLLARHAAEPSLALVLGMVARARSRLAEVQVPRTVTNGCLHVENIGFDRNRVAGVEDWGLGKLSGDPLVDLGAFVMSCCEHRLDLVLRGRRSGPVALRRMVRNGLSALRVDPRLSADVLVLAEAGEAASTEESRRRAGMEALQSVVQNGKE